MSNVKSAIVEHLAADAGVSALVSSRIYNGVADPDAAYPYLLIETTSREQVEHQGGRSASRITTVGIECVATDSASADAIADAVETAMVLRETTIGTTTDVMTTNSQTVGRTDVLLNPQDGSHKFLAMVRLGFDIWHPNP